MPRQGQECEVGHARIRTLIDTTEHDEEGTEESTVEADEEDSEDDDFSHIGGALDRQHVYRLRVSVEIKVPCAHGTTCSEEGRCIEPQGRSVVTF